MITYSYNSALQFLIKNKKWVVQRAVITPHLNWYPLHAITKRLEECAPGYSLRCIGTFYEKEGEYSEWILDEACLLSTGKQLEQHPEVVNTLIALWKKKAKLFYTAIQRLEKNGIHNLLNDYTSFMQVYSDAWVPATFTEHFTVWSDKIIERIKATMPAKKYSKSSYLETLVLPPQKSFLNEEEHSALMVGLAIKKKYKDLSSLNVSTLKKTPTLYKKLAKHQKHFFWIRNNYKYSDPITIEQFLETIKEGCMLLTVEQMHKKISELKNYAAIVLKKKKEALSKLNLSQADKASLDLVARVAWLHDQRKKINLIGDHWVNCFIQQASKQYGIEPILLKFMLPPEFVAMLKGKAADVTLLKSRLRGCADFYDNSGNLWIVHGDEFKKLKYDCFVTLDATTVSDFRGTTACNGTVQGEVMVILNMQESFKHGSILVTSMTRPDFVPLMKKAKAIITDEGGITSHAAIISRELGIPCIVGTRIATKVLKTGDVVELRGNHGLIKIIQRKNEGKTRS